MKKKNNSFVGALFRVLTSSKLKQLILDQLEKQIIKTVLKRFLISGGLKGWLIGFVVGELIEEADEHLIEPLFRQLNYIGDVQDGKVTYRKIEEAEDLDAWRDAVRNS